MAFARSETKDRGIPFIEWEGVTPFGADDLLGTAQRRTSKRDEAKRFVRGQLTDGPIPVTQLSERAKLAGISEKTLERARSELGVTSKPLEFGGKRWVSLPAGVCRNLAETEDQDEEKAEADATDTVSAKLAETNVELSDPDGLPHGDADREQPVSLGGSEARDDSVRQSPGGNEEGDDLDHWLDEVFGPSERTNGDGNSSSEDVLGTTAAS